MYFLVLFIVYLSAAMLVILRHLREGRHPPPALPPPQEEKAEQVLSLQDRGLSGPKPEAPPPALEDSVWTAGLAPREQNQQPEAKA